MKLGGIEVNFIYFAGKHINRDKVHWIEKGKLQIQHERKYRLFVFVDFVENVDFFEETFRSEEEANKRYYVLQ